MKKSFVSLYAALFLFGAIAQAQRTCPLQLAGPGAGNLAGANGECAPCGVEVVYTILDNKNCFPTENCYAGNAFEVEGGILVNATNTQITVIWDCEALFHSITHTNPCESEIFLEEAIQICGAPVDPPCCTWQNFCPGINCAMDNLAGECRVLCEDVEVYTIESMQNPEIGCLFTQWTVAGGVILASTNETVTVRWGCDENACYTGSIVADLYADPGRQVLCREAWVESQVCVVKCTEPAPEPDTIWYPAPNAPCPIEFSVQQNCLIFRGNCPACISLNITLRGGSVLSWTGVVLDAGSTESVCFRTTLPIVQVSFLFVGDPAFCGINRSANDHNSGPGWRAWPNPASERLVLENLEPNSQLYLMSLDGRVLISETNADNPTYSFDVSAWPAGIYLVRVKNAANTATQLITVNNR